ncbi:MnhB domain-containing protein [Kitasatospora sp. NPDC097605]|uniref:MnhB domain-containing protein n=1 Tax=Kitasatospora sp. NPDC097605 TaxID=3157226 RepID=UPI00332C8E54
MSAAARLRLFLFGAAVLAAALIAAATGLPAFGGPDHPYGDRAVAAGLARRTANIVSSVNFDQRAFDTLGEESILFASVLGAAMLLRLARDEHRGRPAAESVLPTTRLFGAGLLPVALVFGGYLVAHGQLSPGGGFQGGVVLATALHLAYVAADYRALRRIRPLAVLDVADALAAGAFAALGLVGLAAGAGYLANTLPLGTFNQLSSGGLVPVVNAVVGVEVASGVIVVLAHFLDQAVEVVPDHAGGRD